MKSAVSVCKGRRPVPPIVYDDIDRGIAGAVALGFDGIELHADPAELDRRALLRRLEESGLKLSAIMTGFMVIIYWSSPIIFGGGANAEHVALLISKMSITALALIAVNAIFLVYMKRIAPNRAPKAA